MKRVFRYILIGLTSLGLLACLVGTILYIKKKMTVKEKYALLGDKAPMLNLAGMEFRDLNKNGRLDPYEDARNPVETRVENLLNQKTL